MVDGKTLGDAAPYLRAADVDERRAQKAYAWGQPLAAHGGASTGIDGDVVVGQDFVVLVPLVEALPVVAADEKGEEPVGIVVREGLQRGPGVGGFGQVHLVVTRHQARHVLHGHPCQGESRVVVQKLLLTLPGVLRRHHEPHLVETGGLQQPCGKGDMPIVHGVEGASENAGAQHAHTPKN